MKSRTIKILLFGYVVLACLYFLRLYDNYAWANESWNRCVIQYQTEKQHRIHSREDCIREYVEKKQEGNAGTGGTQPTEAMLREDAEYECNQEPVFNCKLRRWWP